MLSKNTIKDKIIIIFFFAIYLTIIILQPNFRAFHFDEIHACNIARNFNFLEIIKLMPSEGHTFIWYVLIKPFIKGNPLDPTAIKFLNLFFIWLCMLILWLKAPFDKLVKFCIMFSPTFLIIYPTFARCYGVGIFLLFLLMAFFDKKMEKPYLYSILVFLTANTSLIAAVGAGAFGLLFLYEAIKEKNNKNIYIATLCGGITILSLLIQWLNPIIPQYSYSYSFFSNIKETFSCANKNLLILFITSFGLATIFYFKKVKPAFFYFLFCTISLIIIFNCIYCGWAHHHHFLYVYFVLAYWIYLRGTVNKTLVDKIFAMSFCLISIFSFLYIPRRNLPPWNTFPIELMKLIGVNKTIYVNNIGAHIDLIAYSNFYKLRDLTNKPLIRFDNYKYFYIGNSGDKIRILDLIKDAPQNSYLIINDNDLKKFVDTEEFQLKYKPICGLTDYLLYQNFFIIYKIK